MTRARPGNSLARSALFATPGSGESPREAAILVGLATHPALLPSLADRLAETDWQGRSALALAQALLQAVVDGDADEEGVAAAISAPPAAHALERLQSVLRPGDRARLASDAAAHAVSDMIHQALVLHQRARTLHSELKSAERAFSDDPSDANQAWLLDVKARLTSLEGTEASLEQ